MRIQFQVVNFVPVLDTAIYANNDVMAVAKICANAVLNKGAAALLKSLVVIDKDNEKVTFDIVFFDSLPANSIGGLNGAYALNDADADKVLGRLSVLNADYVSSGSTNAEATYKNIDLVLKAAAGSQDIYIALVVRAGTPTFTTASDLSLRLGLEQG